MTDELKPVRCGCGGEAYCRSYENAIRVTEDGYDHAVYCSKCNIETKLYDTEAEAIADGAAFIGKLPPQFRQRLQDLYPNDEARWAELVFSKEYQHFYGETAAETMENIPHTPEGQAEYFKKVMGELKKMNCLAGMIVYCCQDMPYCYVCGHSWCPFETKWGLIDPDGTPKPAYYTVKEIIAATER